MRNRALFLKLLSAVILFGAWEIAGRVPVSYAFPTFFESMAALARMTMDGTIFAAYAETLKPLVVGVAISAVFGIIIGLWVGLSDRFDWLFSPIFIVMQAAPLAALIPLLVMAYGIGLTSKVFVVSIMAMPVIVLNTSATVRNTPVSMKEMARSFMGSDLDVILKIIIPAASPVIFAGLRLGISAGFIGAILSELKITLFLGHRRRRHHYLQPFDRGLPQHVRRDLLDHPFGSFVPQSVGKNRNISLQRK